MPPAKNPNEITIDVTKPVRDGSGGARSYGNVLVCDFDLGDSSVADLDWKPFMELNVEVAVADKNDGTVLVFTRRRVIER